MIPFAAQHRGQSMREAVAEYRARAPKAVVDDDFHLVVADPTAAVQAGAAGASRGGYTSLKLCTT